MYKNEIAKTTLNCYSDTVEWPIVRNLSEIRNLFERINNKKKNKYW